MNVGYLVNGARSGFINRVLGTKTFYAVQGIVFGAVIMAINGAVTWPVACATAAVGVLEILKRDAQAKAELAANASNPDLPNVEAKEIK
jgi:hypothetical protein